MELVAAVAALRSEDVARGAGGVDAYEDRFFFVPFTLDERHVLQSVALLAERDEVEVAIAGGQLHFLADLDEALSLQAVGDEVADGDDLHAPLLGFLLELRHACHRAVLVHDLHQGSHGTKARQLAEVDGGLRVAATAQHTVVLSVERVDVAWATEGLRCGLGVGQGQDSGRAVCCRHTRGATLEFVDGDRKRRAEHRRVVLHLVWQVQFLATAQRHGCTEHAARVLEHEVHLLGCDLLGGNDEVSLVLAVLVIDDNHELTLLEVFQRSLNAAEFEIFHFYLFFIYDSYKCSHSYSRPHAFIFPTSCTIISLADRMACRSWCSLRRKLHILQ